MQKSPSRVVCLGEILFDRLALNPSDSVAAVESWRDYPGGAPANVACALVKLGTPAAFIGCVGQDEAGQELVGILDSIGVDTSGIQKHPQAPTRKVYVLRNRKGDRSFAGFGDFKTEEFADCFLQKSKLNQKLLQEANFLVLGTLELAYPQTRSAIFQALELAKIFNLKVVLDVNRRPMFWPDEKEALPLIERVLKFVNFLKLAEEEAEWLFSTPDVRAIASRLPSLDGILITAGEKDINYCFGNNVGKVTPKAMKVEDTTGAGDAFVAGFIHKLLTGERRSPQAPSFHGGVTVTSNLSSLQEPNAAKQIITYASAVGGLTVTKPGAIDAQATAAEVEKFLKMY